MIGLALIVFVTVFAAGINSSIAKTIDDSFRGEIVLQNTRRLLADPARGARRGSRRGRGPDRLLDHVRHRASSRAGAATIQLAAVDPATLGQVLSLDFQSGDPSAFAAARAERHDPGRELRARQGPRGGRHARACARRLERTATSRCVGTVEGRARPARQGAHRRERHAAVRQAPAQLRAGAARARASPEGRPDGDGRTLQGPLPDGRGPEPEPAQGPAGAAGQPAARADLRAAVAGDRGVGVRDREHAGAVDPRAHARARHAARGRDVAAPGADAWSATRR